MSSDILIHYLYSDGSPSALADEWNTLLTGDPSVGETFSQSKIGAISREMAATMLLAQEEWDKHSAKEIFLSQLSRMQRYDEAQKAIELLNRKLKVTVDAQYLLKMDTTLFRHSFHLDFFAAVPRQPGIAVAIPPEGTQPSLNWELRLDLSRGTRPFNFKHGKLGLSPEHATTFIGNRDGLDLWAMFVHEESWEDESKLHPAGTTFPEISTLSSARLRMFHSWMLYLLVQIGHPGIVCDEEDFYSVNLDHQNANWNFAPGF